MEGIFKTLGELWTSYPTMSPLALFGAVLGLGIAVGWLFFRQRLNIRADHIKVMDASAGDRAPADQLKRQRARVEIAKFMESGQAINSRFQNDLNPPKPEEVQNWGNQVAAYLRELDPSYVPRLRDTSKFHYQGSLSLSSNDTENRYFVQVCLKNLGGFLLELEAE
jgi:hypothetical protein